MWERYQSSARSTREKVTPTLSVPLTAGVALDFWSHPLVNTHTGFLSHLLNATRADTSRRAIIASIPLIGPTLADHIGNFGYSAAMTIPITYLGTKVKEYGTSKDSRIIETFGDIIPIAGLLGIVAINLLAEASTSNHSQFLGDLLFGLGGIVMAHVVTRGLMERYETKSSLSRELDRSVVS